MQEKPHTVRISQSIEASSADAFTKPELLSIWFTEHAEAELEVGGRYSNSDNDKGEFLLIDRPNRVCFTWENEQHCPGTVVNVRFAAADDGGTQVQLEHSEIKNQEGYDDMSTGWSWALDSFKAYLEQRKPIPFGEWESDQKRNKDQVAE